MRDISSAVRDWWVAHPMTYGDVHGEVPSVVGSREFFAQVDARLLSWNQFLHQRCPFDRTFPYEEYRGRRVLEVGCGMGTMAACWHGRARRSALST